MNKWPLLIVLLGALFVTSSCDPECNMDVIPSKPIPENILSLVPYEHEKSYQFKHSEGQVIDFKSFRETHIESVGSRCTDEIEYSVNTTDLIPNYPIAKLSVAIVNLYSPPHLEILFGNYYFTLPTSENEYDAYTKVDSLVLNSNTYHDVFKLKSKHLTNQDAIYADSLYFNFENGIIKLMMSNGEYYEINH